MNTKYILKFKYSTKDIDNNLLPWKDLLCKETIISKSKIEAQKTNSQISNLGLIPEFDSDFDQSQQILYQKSNKSDNKSDNK